MALSLLLLFSITWPPPVTLDQYHTSLTSGDPWRVVDDQGDESGQEQDLRSTNSARRIKALFEQVTGQANLVTCLTTS